MFKSVAFLGLCAILCFVTSIKIFGQSSAQVESVSNEKIPFSFSLSSPATTSAGVFKLDGTLIKTLWSGVKYSTGSHQATWDGTFDNDSLVANGSYEVRVTSNNIEAEWGTIGNTSSASSGPTVHHSANVITSMVFANNYWYYSVGYNEGSAGHFKFDQSKSQVKIDFLPGYGQNTLFEATDGVRLYHAGTGFELEGNVLLAKQFVFATNVSDDKQVNFEYGVKKPVVYGRTYPSAIDVTSTTIFTADPSNSSIPECSIGGMAVQKNGHYLFVSYYDVSKIHVLDKTTGALVQTITSFTAPKSLTIDADDNLWVTSETNTVSRHTVNNDGTLSSSTLTLSGIMAPLATAVSPDGSKIAVADGSVKQQIRFFSTADGVEGTPLGQEGGYATDPTVTNDKFMFKNTKELFREEKTFISFAPDGSFWIGDQGNYRIQHFSSSNEFIETIMNIGYFYSAFADRNNPSRVFANYLEFNVDYSRPLQPDNGSWKLVRNWAYPITLPFDDQFSRLRGVTTLSNGRTYAFLTHSFLNGQLMHRWQVVELPESGNLRFTGIEPEFKKEQFDVFFALNSDGSLLRLSSTKLNAPTRWIKKSLTGFDNSNNPLWGADEVLASIPTITASDPIVDNGITSDQITSTGKIISFSPDSYDENSGRGGGYHLGAVALGGKDWLWKTSVSTHTKYQGQFPTDGAFDIGNGVQYAGNFMMTLDSLIVWGYHGEFWKGSQTNIWNLFSDNGLFLFQFGISGIDALFKGEAAEGMAGNALSGTLMKLPDGDMALISNDESYHGAIQVWRIKGLNTIQQQKIPLNKTGVNLLSAVADGVDLMAGLPFGETLIDGTNGWTRNPADELLNGMAGTWSVTTNRTTYKKAERDVLIFSYPESKGLTKWVKRDLGTNTALSFWKIDGQLSYPEAGGETGENFIDILDGSDRVILRISRPLINNPIMAIKANNGIIVSGDMGKLTQGLLKPQQLTITAIKKDNIKVTFGNYATVTTSILDPLADWQNPKTLRFQMYSDDQRGHQIDVANLKFYRASSAQSNEFRSKNSGNWNDINSWQSHDSTGWKDAETVPDTSAGAITIQAGHTISITDSATVDELVIQDGGVLNVTPNSALIVNDGAGDDISIASSGSLIVKSDSTGTGRIGNSSGTVSGDVTVERYTSSLAKISYRLLSPSVNTSGSTKPFIKDNWQEGQNNTTLKNNSNLLPHFGIHITGSTTGSNGFDATGNGAPSLFTYNPNSDSNWTAVANTNATSLEAKKGYLVLIRGDRSADLRTNNAPSSSIIRTTGKLVTGTQIFTKPKGNRRTALLGNPYPCPINWNAIYNDASTSNAKNFEKFYTYWDPHVGTSGGYVTVGADGTKNIPSSATTEIQSGQAFLVTAKQGIVSPTLTIKESHKSTTNNLSIFRLASKEQFLSSLYFTDAMGTRTMADAVNAVFDNTFSNEIEENDAEEIANLGENIAIRRAGKALSIEGRQPIKESDTLPLSIQRLKEQGYEWQFNPIDFKHPGLRAYLEDKFLNTRIPISLTEATIIPFSVSSNSMSAVQDRFRIIFAPLEALPVNINVTKAYQNAVGIQVEWTTQYEGKVDRYEVERSYDNKQFTLVGKVQSQVGNSSMLSYKFIDDNSQDGNSYYRIKMVEQSGSIKYSNVADVKVTGEKMYFEVYPNPVTTNNFIVQFNNIPKGSYNIQLINMSGLVLYTKTIEHLGGSAGHRILINQNLPSGTYTVQVSGNGMYFTRKVLK